MIGPEKQAMKPTQKSKAAFVKKESAMLAQQIEILCNTFLLALYSNSTLGSDVILVSLQDPFLDPILPDSP